MKLRPLLGAAGAALACAAAAAAAAAPAAQPPRSTVPLLDAAAITARCDGELATARARVAAMEKDRQAGRLLADFNRLAIDTNAFSGPVYLLANVAADAATRNAAQACVEKFTPLETEVFQSRALFKRVDTLRTKDPIDASYRAKLLEGFEDTGASLPDDKRARVKAVTDELAVLGLAFQKAVNEDTTKVTITEAEADGMSADWRKARQRDDAGRLVLGMDYPTVVPFLQNASSEDARRRVWTAFQSRGGQPNLDRLDRALKLREELAQLQGYPDFATLQLRRRMAGTPATVNEFLARVKQAVDEGSRRDLAELRPEKAALAGKPAEQVKVERWDVNFLQERLKRSRYAVDQEKLREYFPTDKAVAFTMRLAEKLYGIRFVAAPVPTWHDSVRYFDVFEAGAKDGKPGAFIGGVYLDLVPREGKYSHAAAFPVIAGSRAAGLKPTSVLVTNFNPKGLDHDELETMLHEFGHALHGVLSTARYADQAGTAVKRDFVEAPSQMFEEWARRPETLAVFAEVCPQCPRLSTEQIGQLDAARRFGRALFYSRQWEYAAFDMRIHTGPARAALPTWVELEREMPLGYVEGTLLPANFGHVMGGYAAGYYGYMWSEVLALDMLSAFRGKLLDPQAGRRYRQAILSRGGEREPMELVQDFIGRKPNTDAFFAEITGRR